MRRSFWDVLGRLLPRQLIWRAVTATLLLAVATGIVLWGLGIFTPTTAPMLIRQIPQLLLELEMHTTESAYLPGEEIEIHLCFENMSSENLNMRRFPPEVEIVLLYPSQVIRFFPAGEETKSLDPEETATYILTWDQRDSNGQQVAPGYYYVDVGRTEIGRGDRTTYTDWSIHKLLIQFPQGAMEKTIEVEQSRTVGGVTITLKRVELSATEAKFYAFATVPGYNLTEEPPLPPPEWVTLHCKANYSVDGGPMRSAGLAGTGFEAEGIRLVWGNLDPVPSDAKELKFVIPKLDEEWSGPWEFQIPLQ